MNHCPSQTLMACAPGMLPHTCVFMSCRFLHSTLETCMRPKTMLVVSASTEHSDSNSVFSPTIKRQLTIEYP
jgi:hypothetical protein